MTHADVRRRLRLVLLVFALAEYRRQTHLVIAGVAKHLLPHAEPMYNQISAYAREAETPWLMQAQEDFGQLSTIDEMALVVQVCACDTRKLLEDEYAAELQAFLAYDLRALRERERCVAVPPPDWAAPQQAAAAAATQPSQVADEHPEYACGAVLKEGVVCAYIAQSPMQLALHKATARDHIVSFVVAFVQVNQCPWCASIFATRQSACRHVLGSFAHGGCVVDCAFRTSQLHEHAELVCPMCSAAFDDLAGYNGHVRSHNSPSSIDLEHRGAPAPPLAGDGCLQPPPRKLATPARRSASAAGSRP